jgi:hypothetical protein
MLFGPLEISGKIYKKSKQTFLMKISFDISDWKKNVEESSEGKKQTRASGMSSRFGNRPELEHPDSVVADQSRYL